MLTPDSVLTEPPSSWTIVPPDQSTSGHTEILISTSSTILTLDTLERIDQLIDRGPFSHILLSPNGRFLALITTSNNLWVVSSDFSRSLSEVDISQVDGVEDEGAVERAEWCGDNAVVLCWGAKVVVVGPGGAALRSASSSLPGREAHKWTGTNILLQLFSAARPTVYGSSLQLHVISCKRSPVRRTHVSAQLEAYSDLFRPLARSLSTWF